MINDSIFLFSPAFFELIWIWFFLNIGKDFFFWNLNNFSEQKQMQNKNSL